MQDEVVFPAFGIDGAKFWTRCSELVRDHGYDNELAYMKVLLDTLGMDRPNKWSRKSPTALSSSASLQSTPVPSARRSTDW